MGEGGTGNRAPRTLAASGRSLRPSALLNIFRGRPDRGRDGDGVQQAKGVIEAGAANGSRHALVSPP